MSYQILPPQQTGSKYLILEITDLAGVETRDKSMARNADEFNSLQNVLLKGRGFEKRPGSATYGSLLPGTKVASLGFLEQDSGITSLAMVNQTLFKYSSGWVAGDKTNYTADTFASVITMTSKSGAALDSGTSTAGTTSYLIEDTGKTWTPGQHVGRCVLIKGEVKFITDNSATILFLGDKLNSDTASVYQTQAYGIYAVTPFAFVANGVDYVQKYDLTTTTAIDGTQVTNGMALPRFSFISSYQGRLVGSLATGNNNDRIFLMDQGIGENITTDTNLNINLNFFNDGDAVAAHGSLPLANGSILLVAKEKSVHAVEGTNILNYTSRPVFSSLGCIAPKTFKLYGGRAIFLSQVGVMSIGKDIEYLNRYTGQLLTSDESFPISYPIQDEIDALSDAEKANACAEFFNHKYYLQIGSKAWYYDLEQSNRQQRNVWVPLSFPYAFNDLAVINNALYGGSQSSGQVYQLLSGTKDGTTNVTMQLESSDITLPGIPNAWLDRVEFTAEQELSTVVKLQVATDGGSYGAVISNTLDNTDKVYRYDIGVRCKSFKLRFTENGSQTPPRIHLPLRIFFIVSDFGSSGSNQGSL